MRIEKEIQLINEIVCQAIIHGGDAGGSYSSNTGGLVKTLNNWIKAKGKENLYRVGITKFLDESNRIVIYDVPLIVNINDNIPEYEPKPIDF